MEYYSAEYITEKICIKKPVLLIDEEKIFMDCSKAISTCVLGNDYPFWDCHFIGKPVMPGTYMLEMIAQSAAFFEMKFTGCKEVPIIVSINKVRFLRDIKPGYIAMVEISLKKISGCYFTIQGQLKCDGKLTAKAEMVHYIKE